MSSKPDEGKENQMNEPGGPGEGVSNPTEATSAGAAGESSEGIFSADKDDEGSETSDLSDLISRTATESKRKAASSDEDDPPDEASPRDIVVDDLSTYEWNQKEVDELLREAGITPASDGLTPPDASAKSEDDEDVDADENRTNSADLSEVVWPTTDVNLKSRLLIDVEKPLVDQSQTDYGEDDAIGVDRDGNSYFVAEDFNGESANGPALFAAAVKSDATGLLGSYTSGSPASSMSGNDFLSAIEKPSEILTNAGFPHAETVTVNGPGDGDAALAMHIASHVTSPAAIRLLGLGLAKGDLIDEFFKLLGWRKDTPIRRDTAVRVKEKQVHEQMHQAATNVGFAHGFVTYVLAHCCYRIFVHMGIVGKDVPKVLVRDHQQQVATRADIVTSVTEGNLRTLFSEDQFKAFARDIERDITPNALSQQIGEFLQQRAYGLEAVRLSLLHIKRVTTLLRAYMVDRKSVPEELRASAELKNLLGIFNFFALALRPQHATTAGVGAYMRSLRFVSEVINSTPHLKRMRISDYCKRFGFMPVDTMGYFRGGVLYKYDVAGPAPHVYNVSSIYRNGQKANGEEKAQISSQDAHMVYLWPDTYSAFSDVGSTFQKSVYSLRAIQGLAQLAADELAFDTSVATKGFYQPPRLQALYVSKDDLAVLAVHLSSSIHVYSNGSWTGRLKILFATQVLDRWISNVASATSRIAYFKDAASTVLFGLGSRDPGRDKDPSFKPEVPKPILPAANKSFMVASATSKLSFSNAIETVHSHKTGLTVRDKTGKRLLLTFHIVYMADVLGMPDLRGNLQQVVSGVKRDYMVVNSYTKNFTEVLFTVADAYLSSKDQYVRSRAQSWLVEIFDPILNHSLTAKIVSEAYTHLLEMTGLDARILYPREKELTVLLAMYTAVGYLAAWGYLDKSMVAKVASAIPLHVLTAHANTVINGLSGVVAFSPN